MSRLFGSTVAAALLAAACAPAGTSFSAANARAHLDMLGHTIGSRWIGTPANARARDYVAGELRRFGYDVRLEPAIARRPDLGLSARVTNVVATRAGRQPEAIALVSHYDSVSDGPGGADDGFGVAVSLEAARALAAAPLRHTLMILVTDGEEAGLLGAAAAADDPAVGGRIAAYLNLEAVGSAGPPLLFQTGPGNAWLTRVWADDAPRPRGSSLGFEVYRRLPNDTDFTMFAARGVPGLNFALTGDGYSYHTSRDVPERVPDAALAGLGANVVAVVHALDARDLSRRTAGAATYFDLAGLTAMSYGPYPTLVAGILAILLAAAGWWRVARQAVRDAGLGRLLLTLAWTLAGLAAIAAALAGAVWALREVRTVYHPWYARPDWLLALLLSAGVTAGWGVFRVATLLPAAVRGVRRPAVVWTFALPVWAALAAATLWLAPAASFLYVVPLAAAGLASLVAPPARGGALAAASLAVLAVAALFWARDTLLLFHFAVTLFGRLPVVTPVFVYPVLVGAAALMLAPPALAALAAVAFTRRPPIVTASCLLAVTISGGLAYAAPAYTADRPLRRQVRFVQDGVTGFALWEVGADEPGIDLGPGSGVDWLPARGAPRAAVRLRALPQPFVFRGETAAAWPPPAVVTAARVARSQDVELTVTVTPREPGLTVAFVLPAGVTPLGANLPGRTGPDGRWTAAFVSPPDEGLELHAFFDPSAAAALAGTTVVLTSITLPGQPLGARLPDWLTTDRTAWHSRAVYVVRPAEAAGGDTRAPLW